jgi:HlyD family secretion protein/adhesin transport system membrane fusion protein
MKKSKASGTSHSAREKQLRYLSQSVRLEEAVHPRLVHMTMAGVTLAVVAFVAWASVANIKEVARAPGEIVPRGFQQVVQHFDGGIVGEISVKEGQVVEKGDVLLRLDGSGARQDLERARKQKVTLELQRERLRAFVEDRNPEFARVSGASITQIAEQQKSFNSMIDARAKEREIIEDQVEQKKFAIGMLNSRRATAGQNVKLMQDMHDRRQTLHSRGYVSQIGYIQTQRDLNASRGELNALSREIEMSKASLQEYDKRLESMSATHRDAAYQLMDQVEAQLLQNEEIISKADERVQRLDVRAPLRGLVKGLSVNTIGGVVAPGQSLMEIVPMDDNLVVEVRIPPRYIGPLKIGQPVQIKVSSYDFSRYGSVTGTLDFISATTFTGENGERFYRGRILLDKNYVGNERQKNMIMPGMTVMADIITGDKTILEYLIKPVHRAMLSSFSER